MSFTLYLEKDSFVIEPPLHNGSSSCLVIAQELCKTVEGTQCEPEEFRLVISEEGRSGAMQEQEPRTIQVEAILGVVKLVRGFYLGIVTRSKVVLRNGPRGGTFSQILAADFLPVPYKGEGRTRELDNVELHCEMEMLEKLHQVVESQSLYFSHNYDITQAAQRIALLEDMNNPFLEDGCSGLWTFAQLELEKRNSAQQQSQKANQNNSGRSLIGKSNSASESFLTQYHRADPRFMWNQQLITPFVQAGFEDWVHPIMCGYIEARQNLPFSLGGASDTKIGFAYVFISRRACTRQGTRFFVRGLDMSGNAANFVETEQLILPDVSKNSTSVDIALCSHIQTRGSIPLIWSQNPTLKYTPKVKLDIGGDLSMQAFRKHFTGLTSQHNLGNYGSVTCVNLVDRIGSSSIVRDQRSLGDAYRACISSLNDHRLRLVWFDFHHECKGMKLTNLSKLLEQVDDELDKFGFFVQLKNLQVERWQTGVFRTNCMDNLDRTNVVQSVLARQTLLDMLRFVFSNVPEGRAQVSESLMTQVKAQDRSQFLNSRHRAIEAAFQDCWRSNANTMSVLYAGTPALKTRVGLSGKIQDGLNSVTRYVINNFLDGGKQDAVNLFLGEVDVQAVLGSKRNKDYQHYLIRQAEKKRQVLYSGLGLAAVLSLMLGLSTVFVLVFTLLIVIAQHVLRKGISSEWASRPTYTDKHYT